MSDTPKWTPGHCLDCAHWVTPEECDESGDTNSLHVFRQTPRFEEYRLCLKTLVFGGQGEGMAIACDFEQYEAGLFTLPEFGCIQFQARGEK